MILLDSKPNDGRSDQKKKAGHCCGLQTHTTTTTTGVFVVEAVGFLLHQSGGQASGVTSFFIPGTSLQGDRLAPPYHPFVWLVPPPPPPPPGHLTTVCKASTTTCPSSNYIRNHVTGLRFDWSRSCGVTGCDILCVLVRVWGMRRRGARGARAATQAIPTTTATTPASSTLRTTPSPSSAQFGCGSQRIGIGRWFRSGFAGPYQSTGAAWTNRPRAADHFGTHTGTPSGRRRYLHCRCLRKIIM